VHPIRLLIADDHATFRQGLCMLFDIEPDIEVVGEAIDGRDAVVQARDLQPDVILMDMRMPGIDGIEATIEILSHYPHIAIVLLSIEDSLDHRTQALAFGALGYLLKGSEPDDLFDTVRRVYKGELLIDIASRVVPTVTQPAPARDWLGNATSASRGVGDAASEIWSLSATELRALRLIAEGRTNKDIAVALGLSQSATQIYVSNLLHKLQVENSFQAVILAMQRGLLQDLVSNPRGTPGTEAS
jgi:two-component system, NarL family, response regulator LiaR